MRILPCAALPVALAVTACFNPSTDDATEGATGSTGGDPSTGMAPTTMNPTASSTSPGESTAADPDGTTAATATDDGTTAGVDDTSGGTTSEPGTSSSSGGFVAECDDGVPSPGELCFDGATAVSATDVMYSPRLGDVDGDDISDLVFLIGDQIVIHPGVGDGTFGNGQFDETVFGTDAELVDTTDDGNLDVVLTAFFNEQLTTAVGAGDGTFEIQDTVTTGPSPMVLTPALITGDDIPDIIVGGGATGSVRVYESGPGGLNLVETVSTGGAVREVAAGDFNSDDALDVVYSTDDTDTPIGLRLGDGTGNLGTEVDVTTSVDGAFGLAAGDVDNDGNDDLAVAGADSVAVLLGNGAAAFGSETLLTGAGTANYVVIAELTNDDFADVVATYSDSQTVSIWQSNGDGSFDTRLDIAIGTTSDSLAVGDGNGDVVPDIVVGSTNGELATVILSTP